MTKLFFEIIATIKGNVSRETLTPPDFIVSKADAESVEIEIIRRDSRGQILRWEIGLNESLQGDVEGLDIRSGTLLDSGTVILENNGNPIGNFYLRVRDTNRPNYNDGIQAIQFVQIEEQTPLSEPNFTLTPLVDSVLVNLTPVVNATRYILDTSTGTIWINRETDYLINDQPYEITGLSEETAYQVRITATSDSLLFRDSFSIRSTTTLETPQLPAPTDLTFEDLGSGNVRIGVVYSGVSGVTYVIERNEVEVYSGAGSTDDVPGFIDDTSYVIRTKVQKAGYDDSEWYSETYTHQDTPVDWLTFEQFGGQAYYKRIDEGLNYVSLNNGTTRITYTGVDDIFDSEDVGKRFCGLYAHKNPATPNPSNINEYYPNIEGSRYCDVVSMVNGKTIIVNFQFNLNRTNWAGYIFFDNSKVFADMIDSYFAGDREEIRLIAGNTYVVPEFTSDDLPTTKEVKIWTGTEFSANIKYGYEDYFQWGLPNAPKLIKQSGVIFNTTISNFNFISHNINWIPPHRRVPEAAPLSINFFGAPNVGNQSRIIAIVNNDATIEQEEIGEANLRGNFATNAVGFLYAGGTYSGSGILEDVDDPMYMLIKNFKHQGNTMPQLKANSGGGLYFVAEDVVSDNRDSRGYNPWYFEGMVKLTDNRSGFDSSITSRSYYPSHVLELTSDNSWYQISSGSINYGYGNAGNVIQIGGFVFWQPVATFWNYLYETWYSRGNAKKTWIMSESGSENFNSQKMMIHSIPRSGRTYTIGRSYNLGSGTTIESYRNSRVRGNVNWCAVFNKRMDLINPVTEIPANAIPLEFQPGDKFTIVGHGSTVYEVIKTERLDHPHWMKEPQLWGSFGGDGYYASEYYLDKELPSSLGLSFEVVIQESKAEVLFDGVSRPMYGAYKANLALRSADIFGDYQVRDHDKNTTMAHGNIVASDPFGHTSYNHQEIAMWAKNYEHLGDYRQSQNAYPTTYTVPNPATGQNIVTGPLRKYSKGYTMINCSGFVRQFNPVAQFEIRDLIRKSQGINLSESVKEKLRMYDCTDMNGLELQSGPYLENYPDDTGAPDMPAPCRDLLDSLPN